MSQTIAEFVSLPWMRKIHVLMRVRIVGALPRNQGRSWGDVDWAAWTAKQLRTNPTLEAQIAEEIKHVNGGTR